MIDVANLLEDALTFARFVQLGGFRRSGFDGLGCDLRNAIHMLRHQPGGFAVAGMFSPLPGIFDAIEASTQVGILFVGQTFNSDLRCTGRFQIGDRIPVEQILQNIRTPLGHVGFTAQMFVRVDQHGRLDVGT